MPCASATLTVWTSAWLAGAAAPDDVLDALTPWAEAHDVLTAHPAAATLFGLPGPVEPPTSLAFLLAALRRTDSTVRTPARLVLPAPGDPRGLPGPGPFSQAAMEAGQGVLFADSGLGLVPARAADGLLRWTVHQVAEPIVAEELMTLSEAEHGLRAQVHESTSTLTALGVARHRAGVRQEIAAVLKARPASLWPSGMPAQALRVLQHADEVDAILAAASVDAPGAAPPAAEVMARTEALRPLTTAVRDARRAAVAGAVRALVPR